MPNSKNDLTETQEAICQHYITLREHTGAIAEKVGCSMAYLYEALNYPKVVDRINDLRITDAKRLQVSRTVVMNELMACATSDITEVIICTNTEELRALPLSVRRAIKSVEQIQIEKKNARGKTVAIQTKLKFTMHSKSNALNILEECTRERHTGDDDVPPFSGLTMKFLPRPEVKK